MATWKLGIFPATVNSSPTLLHLWSNGVWASLVPPVLENGDGANIAMYQNNSTIIDANRGSTVGQVSGQGNNSLVNLSAVTTDADLTVTMNSQPLGSSAPFTGGSVSPANSEWLWTGSTSMTSGGVYRFTLSVTVDNVTYAGDPEMIVQG